MSPWNSWRNSWCGYVSIGEKASDRYMVVWGGFWLWETWSPLETRDQDMWLEAHLFWTCEKDVLVQMRGLGGEEAKAWSTREPDSEMDVQIWKHQAELKLTTWIWTSGRNQAPNWVRDPQTNIYTISSSCYGTASCLISSYLINHASPILSNELFNTSVWMLWNSSLFNLLHLIIVWSCGHYYKVCVCALIGKRLGAEGCMLTFICWHIAQLAI